MRNHPERWTLLVALLLVGMVYTSQRNFQSQSRRDDRNQVNAALASCARGTVLRTQVNAIEVNVQANQDALVIFLKAAIVARKAAGKPLDLEAAKVYEKTLKDLLASPPFSKVDQPNCRQVVAHPVVPAGLR